MSTHNHIPGVLAFALFVALVVLMHSVAGNPGTGTAGHLPDGPVAIAGLY